MKKLLFLLLFLACLLPVHVQAQAPSHFTVNPAYVPIVILIYCPYSTNYTLPVVSSTNYSSYIMTENVTGNLIEFIFTTGDVDIFNIGITLYYPVPISQTVNIVVYQGTPKIESNSQVYVSGVVLSLTLTVPTSEQPHFPSPADIWNYGFGLAPTKQDFLGWASDLENAIAVMHTNEMWMWVVIGLESVVIIALVFRRTAPKETR